MARRRVLLHDEHAGADPTGRELLVPLALHRLDRDVGDTAARAEERDERVDSVRFPLGMQQHAVVARRRARPTEDTEVARAERRRVSQRGGGVRPRPRRCPSDGDGDPAREQPPRAHRLSFTTSVAEPATTFALPL